MTQQKDLPPIVDDGTDPLSPEQQAASADTIDLDTDGLQAAKDAAEEPLNDDWQPFEDDLPMPPQTLNEDEAYRQTAHMSVEKGCSRLKTALYGIIGIGIVAGFIALGITVAETPSGGGGSVGPAVASVAGAAANDSEKDEGEVLEMEPDPVGSVAVTDDGPGLQQDACAEPPDQETWFRCMNAGYDALRAETKALRTEVEALRGRKASVPGHIKVFATLGFGAAVTLFLLGVIRLFRKNGAAAPDRSAGDVEDLS